ncbi:MAG: rhodanese-like domain-containing protein [Acidimicrobiales bacterium]
MNAFDLAERLDDVRILDVRWQNEWDAGHIDGAVHIPVDELDDRIGDLSGDRRWVTVCLSGNRSAGAAGTLAAAGLEAENLEGGIAGWADAGLPLVRPDGQPGRVVEPQQPPEHLQRLEKEFLHVLFEVEEHFGDREPSDDEVRAFLRDRLIEQGRTPEEADHLMASLDEGA